MTLDVRRWQGPVEVKVAVCLLAGLGVGHVLIGFIVLAGGAGPQVLVVPGTALVLGTLVAAGIVLRMASSRLAGYVVTGFLALAHVLIALGGGLWFVKVYSGLAAAGYVYAAVLLTSGPLVRYVRGVRR